jgi:intein/homing endonuclease
MDESKKPDRALNSGFLDSLYNKYLAKSKGIDPDVWRWPPAKIDEFLLDEKYMNLGSVLRGCVKDDILNFFENVDESDPWARKYQDGIFCEGIGSGKSFKLSTMAVFFLHLLLCLRKPQVYFRCAHSSKLAIMNMCFAGDQAIRLSDGKMIDFSTLYKQQEEIGVSSFNLNKHAFESRKALKCVKAGVKKIKKIVFANGRTLRLSETHPLLTYVRSSQGRQYEWIPVNKLTVGTRIRVGEYVAGGKPSGMSSDEIKLLAYVLGDCKLTSQGIQILSLYNRVIEDIRALVSRYGCVNPAEASKGDLQGVTADSPQINRFLEKYGMVEYVEEEKFIGGQLVKTGKKVKDIVKKIPECIIGAEENEVLLFLSRLWSSYGSIGFGHKVTMTFTAPNKEFIEAVVDMLSRFGIVTKYYEATGKYQQYRETKVWRLNISDVQSKELFLDKIGRYGLDIEGFRMYKGSIGDYFQWSEVESLTDDGEEMTYDVEVPETNNLVVNGMVCHNSVSAQNASKVIFSEMKSKIDDCPWFQARPWDRPDARVPDPACLSELRFKNNIFIIPGSSNWRSAVGYNIVVGIIDEAGNYRASDNSDQAEDIYNAMKRRLGSRFEEKGACIVAGSPMYESDFLERKIKEAKDSSVTTYVKRRTLWESKYPDWAGEVFYVDHINKIVYDVLPDKANMKDFDAIPKLPFLYEAFKQNTTKAYRDFGARPSFTISSFFEQPKVLIDHINTKREDPLDTNGRFKPWFKPLDKYAFHTIHVDIGISGDALGFAMGHFNGLTPCGGIKTYIDLMVRMKGSQTEPIQIASVRELIYSLTNMGFNIGLITFDGFQSTDCMQILKNRRYTVEYLSLDRSMLPYNNFKASVNENRIDYYMVKSGNPESPSASEVFVREATQLEDIQGKKVEHPPKGCFSADTRVALIDGTNPTFEQLVAQKGNERFWVFTFDGKRIVAGEAHSAKMTKVAEVVEIELDNFQVVRCTPDHLFMLFNGEYVRADNLRKGSSLMPLYKSVALKGGWFEYERIWQPIDCRRELVHKIVAVQYGIEGEIVHHIDGNKRNNVPSNLEGMTKACHAKYHTKKRHSEDMFYHKKVAEATSEYARSSKGRQKSRETICANLPKILASRTSKKKNHQVLSIRKTGEVLPVYDLTVDKTHNFALASGIFVHNSKDVSDAVAGVNHNIVESHDRYGKIQAKIVRG